MREAKINNYQKKLRKAISEIFNKASKRPRAAQLLQTIVELGSHYLEAKSCSILLCDEEDNILRIRAQAPASEGQKLLNAGACYYFPNRQPFSPINKPLFVVDSIVNLYRLAFKDPVNHNEKDFFKGISENDKLSLTPYLDFIKQKDFDGLVQKLIEDGNLTMGITASVMKTNNTVNLNGSEVRKHLEWRGGYEELQGEICTSIIEVPLKVGKEPKGVIKIENHRDCNKIGSWNQLIRDEGKDNIVVFGIQHKEFLEVLSECVMPALTEATKEWSYKSLCGKPLREAILRLKPGILKGRANRQICITLAGFCDDQNIWDLRGSEIVYLSIKDVTIKLLNSLKLRKYRTVLENMLKSEALLRIDPKYRDHFIHQFQVFLMGYAIINNCMPIMQELITHIKLRGVKGGDDELADDVLRCWLLLCLHHDVAYSIEKYESWLGHYFSELFPSPIAIPAPGSLGGKQFLDDLGLAIPWGNLFGIYSGVFGYYMIRLHDLINEQIGEGDEEKRRQIFTLLTEKLLKEQNHGLFGALFLQYFLSQTTPKNIKSNEAIFVEEAALAIALHTSDIYSRLHNEIQIDLKPEKFPFAFLLMFCDNAQDWGRPRVSELVDEKGISKPPDVILKEFNVTGNKVFIKLDYRNPRSANWVDVMNRAKCWKFDWAGTSFSLERVGKLDLSLP